MAFIKFRFILLLFLFLSSLECGYPLGRKFEKCAIIKHKDCEITIATSADYLLGWIKTGLKTSPKSAKGMESSGSFSIRKMNEGGTALINVFHFLNQNKFGPKDDKTNYTNSNGDPIQPHIVSAMLNE